MPANAYYNSISSCPHPSSPTATCCPSTLLQLHCIYWWVHTLYCIKDVVSCTLLNGQHDMIPVLVPFDSVEEVSIFHVFVSHHPSLLLTKPSLYKQGLYIAKIVLAMFWPSSGTYTPRSWDLNHSWSTCHAYFMCVSYILGRISSMIQGCNCSTHVSGMCRH